MSARDAILQRIRATLAGEPDASPPPVPELWPPETRTPSADLAEKFLEELAKVNGEGFHCASITEAQQHFVRLCRQPGWDSIGVVDHPLCRASVARLEQTTLTWVMPDSDAKTLSEISVGVLPTDFLLADTGTAVVAATCLGKQLICYLPPTVVLIAEMRTLVAHMSDMWNRLAGLVADPAVRGEFVLVTGPSRTADIEKT